jgi:iron complex transport system ATP-binding protein
LGHRDTILEFRGVGFSYSRGDCFIDDLSFPIKSGDFIGLLGANGSGKSTILKLGSGILKASSGMVELWGRPVHSYRHKDRAKLLSYLPQILDMNIPFTVEELVSMGLYPYDTPPDLSVGEAIDMVGLMGYKDTPLRNLSGGERRRAYIAMTLLQGAGLLLLDEPLANLDIRYQIEFLRLLRELRDRRQIAILMALHDINMALQFEEIMLIKGGRLIGKGHPEEVLNKDSIREAFDIEVEIKRDTEGAYIRCI